MISSRKNNKTNTAKGRTGVPRSLLWGSIVAVVVVVVALVAVFSGNQDEEAKEPQKQRTKQIATATPAQPSVSKADEKPHDEYITNRHGQVVKKIQEKTYVDERGILRYEGGARVYDHSKPRTPIKAMQNDPFPKLKYKSDYEIATLIIVQPGGMLFGSVTYDDRFKQAFVESLLDKNEPENGDSEWDIELKAAVEETKCELAERIKAGEDLGEILTEAREEARRLAAYKRDIQSLLGEAMRDGEFSDDDVRDAIKAANKMLEDKGLAPFDEDTFLRRRMRILYADKKREDAASSK